LQSGDILTTIGYSLTSENYCAEISVEVGLIGSIEIFEDAYYITKRNSFIVGTRAYFLVSIDSELNSRTKVVYFSNTELVTVTVRAQGTTTPIKIFQNMLPTIFPPNSDPKVDIKVDDRANTQQVGFNFIFSKELASQLSANGKLSFTIGAEVKVSYSQQLKKRDIEQSEENEISTFSTDASMIDYINTDQSAFIPPTSYITDIGTSIAESSSADFGTSTLTSQIKYQSGNSDNSSYLMVTLILLFIFILI
jgi:hypothetical protein